MSTALAALLGGAISWTLVEYLFHRFRGHDPASQAAFSRHHLQHHADPRYFAPVAYKLFAAARATLLIAPPAVLLGGVWAGSAFVLGFLGGYAAYEWLHSHLHARPPRTAYGRWARRHHFYHHFRATKRNHGVTSPIWDLAFGTYSSPGRVRVPRRHAPVWMCNPETLAVRAELQGDYALSGRAARETLAAPEPSQPVALTGSETSVQCASS